MQKKFLTILVFASLYQLFFTYDSIVYDLEALKVAPYVIIKILNAIVYIRPAYCEQVGHIKVGTFLSILNW